MHVKIEKKSIQILIKLSMKKFLEYIADLYNINVTTMF